MIFSPSEVSLRKPSENSYVSARLSGDGDVSKLRRDQTTYNYKFAGLDTESV